MKKETFFGVSKNWPPVNHVCFFRRFLDECALVKWGQKAKKKETWIQETESNIEWDQDVGLMQFQAYSCSVELWEEAVQIGRLEDFRINVSKIDMELVNSFWSYGKMYQEFFRAVGWCGKTWDVERKLNKWKHLFTPGK